MGGRTVINYALDYKQYISKMIIISSAGVGYASPLIRVSILKTILPAVVSERFVCFCHFVCIFTLFNGWTSVISGIKDFVS